MFEGSGIRPFGHHCCCFVFWVVFLQAHSVKLVFRKLFAVLETVFEVGDLDYGVEGRGDHNIFELLVVVFTILFEVVAIEEGEAVVVFAFEEDWHVFHVVFGVEVDFGADCAHVLFLMLDVAYVKRVDLAAVKVVYTEDIEVCYVLLL